MFGFSDFKECANGIVVGQIQAEVAGIPYLDRDQSLCGIGIGKDVVDLDAVIFTAEGVISFRQ